MSNIGNKETLAKNLTFYVDKSGKTKKELSEIFGVAASTFNDWTKGKKYPRIDRIELMANYFGVLKSDLIEEKSLKERINENPVGMAELHFEILMDEDLTGLFDDFKKLDKAQKKIVADLVHSLAATKKEA